MNTCNCGLIHTINAKEKNKMRCNCWLFNAIDQYAKEKREIDVIVDSFILSIYYRYGMNIRYKYAKEKREKDCIVD